MQCPLIGCKSVLCEHERIKQLELKLSRNFFENWELIMCGLNLPDNSVIMKQMKP